MKKIYTLAIAALLTVGANAAVKSHLASDATVKMNNSFVSSTPNLLKKSDNKPLSTKAVITIEDLEGTYDWSCQTLLSSNGEDMYSSDYLEIKVTDAAAGAVDIYGWVEGLNFVVKGTVDMAAMTLTIANGQDLGQDTYGDQNYFYLKDVTSEGKLVAGKGSAEATVGTIDDAGISFPPLDVWAIGDFNDEALGWWSLTFSNSIDFPVEIDEVQEGQWDVVGTCTLQDAWITPSYDTQAGAQFIPAENLIHAELQQNVANKNIYRVWRPYHDENWPLVGANMSNLNGQLVFDVTDPDHVIMQSCIPSGFKNANGEFYCQNQLGSLINYYKTELGAEWSDDLIPTLIEISETDTTDPITVWDTFKDGVITINKSGFDIAATCMKFYTWKDNAYVVSTVTFPAGDAGVNEIGADNANAPVKYYNLQGVEISNPEAGQLVIRRQGTNTTKLIVK